ncbi:sirohydrochlorin ferrochelatase [Murinocardiopsis flavida]|uniref:Sirohydrochlorin ferrochelatase n=1 Tax=Murinocardiopsis flavida TaxID=645275 RepID=A0A2P8DIY7_9ACTN|nr:CbiX/SirB N-terminal domain-containing protein [Murinocardiopsis flavida]PSK97197.1 sirohydrochlorin ferrochelatase [Murinocardiopsis flavida]
MVPTMVLAADGTRDANRWEALEGLAAAVADRGEAPVVAAFGPRSGFNAAVGAVEGPLVVVPAFVAGGDLASAEMLAGLDLGGRFDAYATAPLGAVPSIAADLARRLAAAGRRPGDGIVLAADGVHDDEERRQVTMVARMLSRRAQSPVQIGFLSANAPSVADAVQRLHRHGRRNVSVVAWQLLDGAAHERLQEEVEAQHVTAPLWPSEPIVDTLLAQHRAAKARLAA